MTRNRHSDGQRLNTGPVDRWMGDELKPTERYKSPPGVQAPCPQTTPADLVTCPACNGEGGSADYWGEWSECTCCGEGEGTCTAERAAEWPGLVAGLDAQIERQIAEFKAEHPDG